jgi:transposase
MNALQLFKEGLDTIAISERLGVSEAVAYSLLHHAREKERKKKAKADRQRIYNRNYQRRIRQEMREARAGA